ncbi:MAG: phosphomannomutase/phosphoglucomutase [Candidatus Saccharimonadia bacterium]
MNFIETVFKAYDIRGLVGSELTNDLALAVGRGFADFLPDEGPVAVGYDMRPDSKALAEQLRKGIVAQGRDVIDIGEVSSDMIYFATGFLEAAGGAMVTASHNPGQYNGMKLCGRLASGISIDTGLGQIRDTIKSETFKKNVSVGTITKQDITEDWVDHALSFVNAKAWKPFRIAVDAGDGMAGKIFPRIESKIPLSVYGMYFKLDGTFPNHPANPMLPANVAAESAEIVRNKFDFGIAFDGDGDRAFLLDENGQEISASILGAILVEHFLKENPGATILYNAVCSHILPDTIKLLGGVPQRTKVGHSYIKPDMRKYSAPFAAEASGHFYFRDNFNADSGLIAALVAIEVLNNSGLPLSQLAAKYHKYSNSGEINLTVTDKTEVLEKVTQAFPDGEQDNLDGLTISYPNWWFNIRGSNTEPLLRLNIEADRDAVLAEKQAQLLALIKG